MNMFFRQVWTDERLTLPNNISNVAVSTKLLRSIEFSPLFQNQ